MLYANHISNPVGESFLALVNDETLTWESQPPGKDIPKPMTLYFSCHGALGSGKNFTIFPGGRAEHAK